MVDRKRASVIAHRAASGIPRTQVSAAPSPNIEEDTVRISARIPASHRDALRALAARHGLSVASLIDLVGACARGRDAGLEALVEERADAHRRPWGGRRP